MIWSNDSYWSGSLGEIETKAKDLKAKFDNYHANLTVGAELKSSFKGLELKEEEGKDYVTDFDFDSGNLGIAGYGFGIDLGASYKILDNLTVSASILDFGLNQVQRLHLLIRIQSILKEVLMQI